jgi:hypothetical protein
MMSKLIYHDRYIATEGGDIINAVTGKVLRGGRNSKGYLTVSLYDGSSPKRPKSFLIHRLIAEAFLGPSDLQINHKDGNKQNNRIENLEWVTLQQNVDHCRHVLGKDGCGERSPRCKIPSATVERIRRKDRTAQSWADELKCNVEYVYAIRAGRYRKNG